MIGKRFGKLTVVQLSCKNTNNQYVWKCQCDCGNSTEVTTSNLNNGSTQSCGCGKVKTKPKEDLIGQKFNNLTVVSLSDKRDKEYRFLWKCKCDCGSNEIVIATSRDLKTGRKKSCSCLKNKKIKLPIDLTGMTFGKLKAIEMDRNFQSNDGQFKWKCKCDCGAITYVTTRNLISGVTKSCGCIKFNPNSPYKIDKVFKKLLVVWTGMKKRCGNPNYEHYDIYGGRGIVVCREWQSFKPFYKWALSNGYSTGLQIDRINTNGNYEPSNCRWVTPKENSQNKRNNKYITINGETKLISQWAKEADVTTKTINDRIERGWSESELLSGPRKRNSIRKHTGKTLVINQIEKSYSEWAEIIGINQATLRDRVNAGWKEDEILKPKGYRRKISTVFS